MNTLNDTVSVVIPTRNMGEYVVSAVESALSQSAPPHQVIVVDDGSTDGTFERLQSFGPPVQLLRGPGLGSAVARNLGLLAATGTYVAFLDADDLWYPRKLELQLADLAAKGATFGYTDYVSGPAPSQTGMRMLDNFPEAPEGLVFEKLLRRNFVLTSSVIVRRDELARSGIFRPSLIGGQDIDLWLRLARVARFACMREPLTFYRLHGGNITSSDRYALYHARRWESVYREHSDLAAEDRAYIRQRWSDAMFAAGRKAWWTNDFALARQCFRETLETFGFERRTLFWYLLMSLPHRWLKSVRSRRTAAVKPNS